MNASSRMLRDGKTMLMRYYCARRTKYGTYTKTYTYCKSKCSKYSKFSKCTHYERRNVDVVTIPESPYEPHLRYLPRLP